MHVNLSIFMFCNTFKPCVMCKDAEIPCFVSAQENSAIRHCSIFLSQNGCQVTHFFSHHIFTGIYYKLRRKTFFKTEIKMPEPKKSVFFFPLPLSCNKSASKQVHKSNTAHFPLTAARVDPLEYLFCSKRKDDRL